MNPIFIQYFKLLYQIFKYIFIRHFYFIFFIILLTISKKCQILRLGRKKEKIDELSSKFEEIIKDSEIKKGIAIFNFRVIKMEFFDIDVETDKKEDKKISNLIHIIERTKNYEPLYHSLSKNIFKEKKLVDKYIKNDHLYEVVYELYEWIYEKKTFSNKKGKEIHSHQRLIDYQYKNN